MKEKSSKFIRMQNDQNAFDPEVWEFQSRQFFLSAEYLLESHDALIKNPTLKAIALLPTAEFLLCLALELIWKAYYLRSNSGSREKIYTHNFEEILSADLFNNEQLGLLNHAGRYVVWAGRYPTPKWTKESFKEGADVPSHTMNGVEHIDASKLPNVSSRPRTVKLVDLYNYIHTIWQQVGGA